MNDFEKFKDEVSIRVVEGYNLVDVCMPFVVEKASNYKPSKERIREMFPEMSDRLPFVPMKDEIVKVQIISDIINLNWSVSPLARMSLPNSTILVLKIAKGIAMRLHNHIVEDCLRAAGLTLMKFTKQTVPLVSWLSEDDVSNILIDDWKKKSKNEQHPPGFKTEEPEMEDICQSLGSGSSNIIKTSKHQKFY